MKKLILFLLLPLWMLGQTPTGQEQEFDYNIKNNAAPTVAVPNYLTTSSALGVYGKIEPINLPVSIATQDSLDLKLNISDLPTNLTLYPTTTASDVGGYVVMVTDIHDVRFDETAVDVSIAAITTTGQLISQRISDAGVLIGQPGVFNITTFGNIRRLSGSGTATFYFEVYHRDLAGTETLICTSSISASVSASSYMEFTASGIWDNGDFIATDRIVIKSYANRIAGGSDPVYQFQFGGTQPVRTLLPVPFSVVDAGYEVKTNKQNSLAVDGTGEKYPTVDAINAGTLYKRTIAEIRALTGILPNNYFYTTDLGREGNWYYDASDTTSADNTGTILVTADGKRIKRIYKDAEIVSWFDSPNNSTDLALFNKIIAASTTKKIIFDKGTFNLQTSNANLVSGLTLIMQGSVIQNGNITGNGATIESLYEYEAIKLTTSGVFGYTKRVYYYKTMQDAKASRNWGGKRISTGGFWYENDGGGAEYTILTYSEADADNIYFDDYWHSTDVAGGAGLFVKMTYNTVYAKYTGRDTELDLAFFGVKYDAKFLNPSDTKYYSDAGFTTLATDNYEQIRGAIGQMVFWSEKTLPKSLVLSGTLIINSTLYLSHGAYNFTLRGSGYAEESVISSNSNLDVLVENYYSSATPNAQTGFLSVFQDITFKGNNRIANGMIVKQGHEADGLARLQFHEFTNAGLVLYGVSSTFKADTMTCFDNKYGILITSTHPYRLTDNTSNCDGLMSLYKVSGDRNTDALIAIDNTVVGGSVNIQSIKSENNDNATILIMRSAATQYISIKNAFSNGDGDFLKIENYVGDLPTIEMEGVFHNDPDTDNYDINDLKNSKQIRFYKNPTASFPHTIYTNGTTEYGNGLSVYRNGDNSTLETTRKSGTTAQRPTGIPIGYSYYDTTLSASIIWNGSSWLSSVTGTGTTNYLPKFSSAYGVANSLFYDNGTFIGLGSTTYNGFKFDVAGSSIFRQTGASSTVYSTITAGSIAFGNRGGGAIPMIATRTASTTSTGLILASIQNADATRTAEADFTFRTGFETGSDAIQNLTTTGLAYSFVNGSANLFNIYRNGLLNIPVTPTTSAGTYDFVTRNTSTGVVEKVTSASIAPVASPALTGTPTAPTATVGTNTTQLATTAFVQSTITTGATSIIKQLTPVSHTGTTVQTDLIDILIPANTLSSSGVYKVFVMASITSGTGSGATLHVDLTGDVTPFIRGVGIGGVGTTPANGATKVEMMIQLNSGFRINHNQSGHYYSDIGISPKTSVAFDTSVDNHLKAGITLVNASDTYQIDYVILKRID